MKIRIQSTDLIILVTVASTTLYMVSRNLPFGIGSFAFLWAPIALFAIFLKRPNSFTKGPIKILFLYGIITISILQYTLWKYMNDWTRIRILLEFYYLFILLVFLNYYKVGRDFKRLANLSKWVFIFIIISTITSNIALYFDPLLVRESARTEIFTPNQERIYNITGAMSYSYLQSLVCLIPILIYYIKNKKNKLPD